jgi:hypothetical protein
MRTPPVQFAVEGRVPARYRGKTMLRIGRRGDTSPQVGLAYANAAFAGVHMVSFGDLLLQGTKRRLH